MWGYIVIGVVAGLFAALFLILLLFSFSPAVAQLVDPVLISFLKDVVGPVSAGFGGAVAGAYAAYWLQRKEQLKREDRHSARILCMAKYLCIDKINELLSIRRSAFEPYLDHQARFAFIGYLPDRSEPLQPVSHDLIELLVFSGASTVINDVFLADKRYASCFVNFKSRNAMFKSFGDVASTVPLDHNLAVDFSEICKVVDTSLIVGLYEYTEDLLKSVDDAVEKLILALSGIGETLDKKINDKGLPSVGFDFQAKDLLSPLPPPYFTKDSLLKYVANSKR